MSEITQILKSAQNSIAQAHKDLSQLENIASNLSEVVPVVLEAAELQKHVSERREQLFALLAQLAFAMSLGSYETSIGYCYRYKVISATEIEIHGGYKSHGQSMEVLNLRGKYTLAEFLAFGEPTVWWEDFCDWIISSMIQFLRQSPISQRHTIAAIEKYVVAINKIKETINPTGTSRRMDEKPSQNREINTIAPSS